MINAAQAIQNAAKTSNSSQKESNLRRLMREMKSVLVAYSGGVDSSYLALIAHQEIGTNALSVLGISPSVSAFQRVEAERVARQFEFNLETIATDEIEDPNYASNRSDRCYFCKTELYGKLASMAAARGIAHVIDGTNADDISDHRPGRIAAVDHLVRSPLAELSFTKEEIRERSKVHGLPTWDQPASPCLASRIAPGVTVTIERLSKVERGEDFMRANGFREFRVRVHGDLVRLEISADEMDRAMTREMSARFAQAFRNLGFRFVTLDLMGFKSGSMNETAERK